MFMYVIGMLGLMLVYCHSKMLLINPVLFLNIIFFRSNIQMVGLV